MNPLTKILITSLSAYVVVLPIWFGFHSMHYDHYEAELRIEETYSFLEQGCGLCDLYDHYITASETSFFYTFNLVNQTREPEYATAAFSVFRAFINLRGPPAR